MRVSARRILVAPFFMMLLLSCSSPSSLRQVASAVPPRPMLFGYYGDCPTCVAETRDHVNVMWIAGWGGPDGSQTDKIIARATAAAPIESVIMLPGMYVDKRLNPAALVAARKIFLGRN